MNVLRVLSSPPGAPIVYLFPHAGGALNDYHPVVREGDRLGWTGLQLRGRGARFTSEPLESVADIVTDALPALVADVGRHGRPYGLFGHSFGSLVAFETTRALLLAGCRKPSHLWVSAFPAPDRIPPSPGLSSLADEHLLALLDQRFGAIPDEVRADAELASIVARYIRSDYRALESYQPPDLEPLPLDVTQFHGRDDAEGVDDIATWRRWCGRTFAFREFPGGHFYLRATENAASLARNMTTSLRMEGEQS